MYYFILTSSLNIHGYELIFIVINNTNYNLLF